MIFVVRPDKKPPAAASRQNALVMDIGGLPDTGGLSQAKNYDNDITISAQFSARVLDPGRGTKRQLDITGEESRRRPAETAQPNFPVR